MSGMIGELRGGLQIGTGIGGETNREEGCRSSIRPLTGLKNQNRMRPQS